MSSAFTSYLITPNAPLEDSNVPSVDGLQLAGSISCTNSVLAVKDILRFQVANTGMYMFSMRATAPLQAVNIQLESVITPTSNATLYLGQQTFNFTNVSTSTGTQTFEFSVFLYAGTSYDWTLFLDTGSGNATVTYDSCRIQPLSFGSVPLTGNPYITNVTINPT